MSTVLDLFCCEGGASEGYHQAGFDRVIGVDYDDKHITGYTDMGHGEWNKMDWLDGLKKFASEVDFIHASPPCQGYSLMQKGSYGNSKQKRLIFEVREALNATNLPWVIENVGGARHELKDPLMLSGEMFNLGATLNVSKKNVWNTKSSLNKNSKGYKVHEKICLNRPAQLFVEARIHRLRLFEFGNMNKPIAPSINKAWKERVNFSVVNGSTTEDWHRLGHRDLNLQERAELLDIKWNMSKLGFAESLPPAYTKFIGQHALKELNL